MEEVITKRGKISLRKPTAGERNKALMAAETKDGEILRMKFIVELIPKIVVEHPFGAEPLVKALDGLDPEDYDLLIESAGHIMGFHVEKGDVEKK